MSNTDFSGMIVSPFNPREYPLRSGCQQYSVAVCISDTPFILVSLGGDMRWQSTVKKEGFYGVRVASNDEMIRCLERF